MMNKVAVGSYVQATVSSCITGTSISVTVLNQELLSGDVINEVPGCPTDGSLAGPPFDNEILGALLGNGKAWARVE